MEEVDQSAVDAYNALLAWVVGFRKNARGATQPIYIWQHDHERREFAALTEDYKAAPFVVSNKLRIGAFPVRAQPPVASQSSPVHTSETMSAIETLDVLSSSPDHEPSSSAEHR